MAISPGTRFGPYEIVDAIGAGGMGEVYRATDTKLGREVAIKTLPSALAADADRLARFEREAKLLAALNHPNIAIIYGLEEQNGTQCIAMELIEGETLEDKLKSGSLSVDDTLRLALQIAQALEAAHEKGVVHRDLKPANVMVTKDSLVKVLDFGLAKAFSADPDQASAGHSPALSLAMTQQGIVLGTASYMSPEQASGQATDQRADVWAFGVVLFEMLSGLPLFTGESVPHILAAVLQTEPDRTRLPKNLHPRLELLLQRCLKKKPRERYHSIADARIDIEDVLSDPEGVEAQSEAHEVVSARPNLRWVAATAVLTAAIAGLLAWALWPMPDPQPVKRFDYDLPDGQAFTGTGRPIMALSPDGRYFAYNSDDGVYLRTMGELEARLISGTGVVRSPVFSPDSQSLVYFDSDLDQLKRIAISGGAPVVITAFPDNVDGLSWAEDGTIFFGQTEGILSVPANGGTPELIIEIEDDEEIYGARLLPDGDSLLFSIGPRGDFDAAQIVAQSLSTGERTVLVEGGSDARYVPTGHLIYALGDGLFAVVFDPDSLTVSGGAVPLVQGVMRSSGATGAANFGVADDGTLVYVSGDASGAGTRTLVWVDREGRQEPINVPRRGYLYAQISPDGTRVALSDFDDEQDVWIWDLERETFQRLTFDPGFNGAPIWSPDGQRVVFSQQADNGQEIFWQAADGSGNPDPLTDGSAVNMHPTDLSPDGTALLYSSLGAGVRSDIWIVPVEGPATAGMPLLASPADERSASVSPDGQWLAYQSDESGQSEIYVRPFPEVTSGRWQVSTGGGESPLWSRDGAELFYYVDGPGGVSDAIMSVSVELGSVFTPGGPEVLFNGDFPSPNGDGSFYDVSLDGQRFLMITEGGGVLEGASAQIIIVENWLPQLERLVPTE